MTEDYKVHIKKKFNKIERFQQVTANEKKIRGELYKDYINSLGSFPQWLTIFSGVAGILGIFNEAFLIFSFVFFLFSSMILLYVKYSKSKKVSAYIKVLDNILSKMSDLTYNMTIFSRGELMENEMKEKEKSFDQQYKDMRESVYLESTKTEDNLISFSFLLSILGGLFLFFSIIGKLIENFLCFFN